MPDSWEFLNYITILNIPDVDECSTGINRCNVNAVCTNTAGSYDCKCKSGYLGKGADCTGTFFTTRNTCMQKPLALPTQELYFPNMKHLKIVVIFTNSILFQKCKNNE